MTDSRQPQMPPPPLTPPRATRATWREPRLTFVEPELTRQGEMTALTGVPFFGTFVP